MKKLVKFLAVGAVLTGAPLATAEAGGERTWQVCGGTPYAGYSGFALCASVTATVTTNSSGHHILTMKIYNLSGTNGSFAGTVFTGIGLDNVVPSSVNLVYGSLKITGPCMESTSGCDYSQYWLMANNVPVGNVRVDLAAGSILSMHSIASDCTLNSGTAPGTTRLFVTDCVANGNDFVTLSFRVTEDFDPSRTGDLFIRGQNGPYGQGTTCLSTSGNCGPYIVAQGPTTVVPEPVTATLVATGMGLWGGVGYIRRRRRGASEA